MSAHVEQMTCPHTTSSFSFLSFFAFFAGAGSSVVSFAGRFEVNRMDLVAFDISREHEGHIGVDFVVSVFDAAG